MINHYQVLCKEFVAAAMKSHDVKAETKYQVYYPNVNYSSTDVYIENNNLEIEGVLNDSDWMMLLLIALGRDGPASKKKKPKSSEASKETEEEKRQQYYQDFLWCCNQNQTRDGSSSGLALPRFKKLVARNRALILRVVVGISDWVSTRNFEWLKGDKKPYTSCLLYTSDAADE